MQSLDARGDERVRRANSLFCSELLSNAGGGSTRTYDALDLK